MSNDKKNMRSPNQDRPLSTYDNLDNETRLNKSTENNYENSHANEFPFTNISFRFDELKQLNALTDFSMNGYKNAGNNFQNHIHQNDNGSKSGNNIQENVSGISQSSSSSPSSTGSTSSISDKTYTESTYLQLSINKPVHSAAKSQFLGLNHSESLSIAIHSSKKESENGESSTVDDGDEEPLLSNFNTRNVLAGSSKLAHSSQNAPINNSSIYGQNQIDDANECTCNRNNNDKQNENNHIKCNKCLDSNKNVKHSNNIGVDPSPNDITVFNLDNAEKVGQSLSQAVYMATTVPQNIKGNNIMGSHLPTRNSLRHSRMLVGKNNYPGVRRRNSLNIRHPKSARFIFVLHILVGLGISCLGLWLCWWAPSTGPRENPYWSGLILTLSGILGLIVLAFKPRPRHRMRQYFISFLRINSTIVTFIAAVCVLVAFIFAYAHLAKIMSPFANCRPVHILVDGSACTCRFDGILNNSTVGSSAIDGQIPDGKYYRDLNCNEVMGPFKYILIASTILNFIGFLLCLTLLILLCMRQKPVKRVPYSSASSRHRL